jgi:membrane protein implicated in regulation of membrane protease activity
MLELCSHNCYQIFVRQVNYPAGGAQLGFYDSWMWLVFIGIGLMLILLELILGVYTGLDLVFIGSAFIVSGLVTWPFHSWLLTLILALAICVLYVALGRRYVHRWTSTRQEKTNIDTIIGKKGTVLRKVSPLASGLVKVGNEEWSARAEENIEKGEEIVVTAVKGVTLSIEKIKGGE